MYHIIQINVGVMIFIRVINVMSLYERIERVLFQIDNISLSLSISLSIPLTLYMHLYIDID